jgi:uncharacterized membrane protein
MIELHPAIVHFPVALLTIAAFFGVLSLFSKKEFFKETAFWNLLIGVIGAIVAVLTGLIEEQILAHNDEIHRILVRHKFTGFGILIASFVLLIWVWVRKNKFGKGEYIAWVFFLVLGTAAVFYQGFLGGKMVFEQGAGVKPMEQNIEDEPGSGKTHDHSSSGHGHNNVANTDSTQKSKQDKTQHDHSSPVHNDSNKQDTSKKQNNDEKKKELKDMKY